MFTQADVDYNGPEILKFTDEDGKLFIREFKKTAIGQTLVKEGRYSPANMQLIADDVQAGDEDAVITFNDFVTSAQELYRVGDLEKFVAPAEPEVERDVKGRVLSSKAKQWKRWQEFCNDSATKMETITALRKSNPAFAEFYRDQQGQEFRVDDPMAAINIALNQKKPRVYTPDPAVLEYAKRYRITPSQVLRNEMSPAINPLGAAEATRLFEAAISAGLI